MDKIAYVRPKKYHEKEAIDFINEFKEFNSPVEGVNNLHRYIDDYENWLKKLENDRTLKLTDNTIPTETFFIIREKDNKIIGIATLRLGTNKKNMAFGGHIGCSIRPTERAKGYGKLQLYMALKIFKEHGFEYIMLDCDKENISSAKNIQALGGILKKETYLDDLKCIKQDYIIDVNKSLEEYKNKYNSYVDTSKIVDNKILDCFYNEFVNEASIGKVDCYFAMNLCFDTSINNKLISPTTLSDNELIKPTLKINNQQVFNNLLTKYIEMAINFYDNKEFSFLNDVDDNIQKEKYLYKYIMSTLFANASLEDFNNPIKFLQNRINMFNEKIIDEKKEYYLNSIDATIQIEEEKSPIRSETPYRVKGKLIFSDNYILPLPDIYMAFDGEKYYIYGIQNTEKEERDIQKDREYNKLIRKGLIAKINGASEHYFLTSMLAMSLAGDKKIVIVPFLPQRWNAKKIANNNFIEFKKKSEISEEEIDNLIKEKDNEQNSIQNNITNKFIHYFKTLEDVSTGINYYTIPLENDDKLEITISPEFESRSILFNEIYEKINEKVDYHR